jgi:hypothetical protein
MEAQGTGPVGHESKRGREEERNSNLWRVKQVIVDATLQYAYHLHPFVWVHKSQANKTKIKILYIDR